MTSRLYMKYLLITFFFYIAECVQIRQGQNASNLLSDANRIISPVPVYNFPLPENTLMVTGSASMNIPSDTIRVGVSIETNNTDSKLAYQMNNDISNAVDKVLTNLYIPENNITTTEFRITPDYANIYIPENQTYLNFFRGYIVTNNLDIVLSDLNKTTQVIDDVINAGVKKINYVNFEVSPELQKKVQYNLIQYATQDAINKATLLADPMGLDLVNVKSIKMSDNVPEYVPMMRFDALSAGGATSAKLYNGQSKQSVSVDITFATRNNNRTALSRIN
jgi:uncharacterized protein YggE